MKIKILTLYPNYFDSFLNNYIIKRAISNKLLSFEIINIRDYSLDKNKRIDDHPIGGGPGLIMSIIPISRALKAHTNNSSHKILLSPIGKKYSQEDAKRLAKEKELVFICGHSEGIDSRIEKEVDEIISLGDFILTSGEIPTIAIIDSVIRLIKGVISDFSPIEESFENNLLEYPQYTYPLVYNNEKIPDILFCGNHMIIKKYQHKQALITTYKNRPDLINYSLLNKEDKKIIDLLKENKEIPLSKEEIQAIEKGKKFIQDK